MKDVLWICKTLYDRGLISGSAGNISFKTDDGILITKSGSCMGKASQNTFAKLDHKDYTDGKPSKEWPIHHALYNSSDDIGAVIHTHSFYSTLFSCSRCESMIDGILSYTPYLNMQTNGNIVVVAYHPPGSKELFDEFRSKIKKDAKVYILKNHGVVVAEKDINKAYYLLEEFEQTCRLYLSINRDIVFDKIQN